VSGAEAHDLRDVVFDPVGEGFDVLGDFAAEVGEAVLDLWWDGWVDGAEDEAVGFKSFERLGQHLFADAADASDQFAEALGAIEKSEEDERSPAGGDVVEYDAGGAIRIVEIAFASPLSACEDLCRGSHVSSLP